MLAEKNNACIDTFLEALIRDINRQINVFEVNEIPTVYIGGGSPSVLGNKIRVLLDALNKIPRFSPVEFTIEANPESLTEDFLCACRGGGINRLSLGVQTFHQPSRTAVNRGGEPVLIEEKLNIASKYFKDAFSADLIIGLPHQSEQTVMNDIKKLLEYNTRHISLYGLSIEKDTPLEQKIKTKTVTLPKSETADNLWLLGRDTLLASGFEHYEVSNFAKKGGECRHNIRYWQMQSWLGAGPAASGTLVNEKQASAKRFTFANDIDAYIKSPCIEDAVFEQLDKNMLMRESILMGFRCKDGPDPVIFRQRFGRTVEECIPKTIEKWKYKDKLLFLNQFLLEAFGELGMRN